jgi:hypothetical protein
MAELNRPREFSGQHTRPGHAVHRSRSRKAVFIAGFAGLVILSVLLMVSACVPTP